MDLFLAPSEIVINLAFNDEELDALNEWSDKCEEKEKLPIGFAILLFNVTFWIFAVNNLIEVLGYG